MDSLFRGKDNDIFVRYRAKQSSFVAKEVDFLAKQTMMMMMMVVSMLPVHSPEDLTIDIDVQ